MPVKNVLDAINGNDSDIGVYDSSSGEDDDDVLANQGLQNQVRILCLSLSVFNHTYWVKFYGIFIPLI